MTNPSRPDLMAAASAGLITESQAEQLSRFFEARGSAQHGQPPTRPHSSSPTFTFVNVLYYMGGMTAISAMSLFMTLGWNALGGFGGCAIAVVYALLALALTHYFLNQKGLQTPAGVTATLATIMVPLAIFGAQQALGYWPDSKPYRDYHVWIDGRWLVMELGTLAIGGLLLRVYRLPFMVMPLAITLWYMSMDLAPLVSLGLGDWENRKWISLVFGVLMLATAIGVDLRPNRSKDYSFWLYIFGVLAFWGGLSLLKSDDELGKLVYCLINLLMILIGVLLDRRVFAVFGGIGVAGYLGYLSRQLFKDSLLFPFALSLIGLVIVWVGVVWQRNEARWSRSLQEVLPRALRDMIQSRPRG